MADGGVYYGDTLCRLHRAPEAWPIYVKGFELAPNDVNLIALGLQCLWDEGHQSRGTSRRARGDEGSPSRLVAPSTSDATSSKGREHGGVDPKYRPRGYNGPEGLSHADGPRRASPATVVTTIVAVIVVARVSRPPQPRSARVGSSAERQEIADRIATQEKEWLRQVGEKRSQDNWSPAR